MESLKTIFAFLPVAYAILGFLLIQSGLEVFGAIMICFSILFGLMGFMVIAVKTSNKAK
jgi:hypothetical protein